MQSIYARRINGAIVVTVGGFGRIPNSDVLIPPHELRSDPTRFINELVELLPQGAIIPIHPNEPEIKYAGSGQFGYVLTVASQYEERLRKVISTLEERSDG